MRRTSDITWLFLLATVAAPGCDVNDAQDAAKACSNVCPVGTSPDLSAKASAQCGGSAGVNVTTQSGTIEGRCYSEGECSVLCVPPAPCCGAMTWSLTEYRCEVSCCPDGTSPPCGDKCSCEGRCGLLSCGVLCPPCGGDQVCSSEGTCVGDCSSSRVCGKYCCGGTETCYQLLCCDPVANCEAKSCGSNGCGGSCGSCDPGESCVGSQCVLDDCPNLCGHAACGPDGCGGSCGQCGADESCVDGDCVPGGCPPSCSDRECGADGCGGSCGSCGQGESCTNGHCTPGDCPTSCEGRACGDDGCGGTCGSCDDGIPCTTDSCSGAGQCSHEASDGPCGDLNPCTDDWCDVALGCKHAPNGQPCNDGSLCTTTDSCVGTVCKGAGALACDDGDPKTADSCDAKKGCVHTDIPEPCVPDCAGRECGDDKCKGSCGSCKDGVTCTNDVCSSGGQCTYTPNDAACSDGNECTDDWCDELKGCAHEANTKPCNDGNACTPNDTCQSNACKGTGTLSCDDGNAGTLDSCEPAGGCVHTPLPYWVDGATGLAWQKAAPSDKKTWSSSQSYCDNLTLGSTKGWRLPSVGELRSVVDGCISVEPGGTCGVTDQCLKPSCANLSANCNGCASGQGPDGGCYWVKDLSGPCDNYYWSSSLLDENYSSSYWSLHYGGAVVKAWNTAATSAYIRCVHDEL